MDGDFDPEAFISGTDTVDTYKQALEQKILSGATDYTYGPGSPGATPADMRQKTGSHDNPLQTGDVALPQKDYNLFSPEERQRLGIADTSWIKEGQPTPRGSVERYFGTDAEGFDPQRFIKRQDISAPSVPDIHAFMEPAPADTPEEKQTQPEGNVGSAIGKAISSFGKALAQAASDSAFPDPGYSATVPNSAGRRATAEHDSNGATYAAGATDALSASTVSAGSATVPD